VNIRIVNFESYHMKLIYLGLIFDVFVPLLLLGLAFVFKGSAFAEVQNPQIGLILIVLLAVSLSHLGVIYVVRKRLLNSLVSSNKRTPSYPTSMFAKASFQVAALSFAIIIYAFALVPSVYGFVYFLLGGSLNWFILFIAVTMLAFLLFKPKEEELKKLSLPENSA